MVLLFFFQSLLHRTTVKDDPKKAVDATLDFVRTVVVGHLLGCACEVLGISDLDDKSKLPQSVKEGTPAEQFSYVHHVATEVVERFTLIEQAYTSDSVHDLGMCTTMLQCFVTLALQC